MANKITVIENNKLFDKLSLLEPEYYYRNTPKEYEIEIKNKWRALLTEFSIRFNPVIFHRYKKAGKIEDRIDLEDDNKHELRIVKSPVVFKLLGDK